MTNSNRPADEKVGPLRELLEAETTAHGISMKDLTVLAVQNDPFRVDTPARHRDGEWLAITARDLGLGDRRIHRHLPSRRVAVGEAEHAHRPPWIALQLRRSRHAPGSTSRESAAAPAGTAEASLNGQSGTVPVLSEGDGTAAVTDVVQAFQKRLELTDPDPLYAMLGTKASLALPGDPVWLLIIDGSSGGKTEMVMPLAALPDVHLCALLTEAGLLSGTSHRERAGDATGGVLREVGEHGVILMKDFTSVLSMQRDTRAQTLAALREIHDGRWSRPVGTDGGQVLRRVGKCAVIAGCTEAWDTAHAVVSMMGDRFLCVRPQHKSRQRFSKRALRGAGDETEVRAELAQTVRSLFNTPTVDPLPVPDEGLLVDVADLVTLARSPIQRDSRGELVLVLAPEMPGRFVKALAGLWGGLTALRCDAPTAWRVVMRVAFDSMPRIRSTVLRVLADAGDWIETRYVRTNAQLPRMTALRALEDLHAHGVIEREDAVVKSKGDRGS